MNYMNPVSFSCVSSSIHTLSSGHADLLPIPLTLQLMPTLGPLPLSLCVESSAPHIHVAVSFWAFWSQLIHHCLRIVFPEHLETLPSPSHHFIFSYFLLLMFLTIWNCLVHLFFTCMLPVFPNRMESLWDQRLCLIWFQSPVPSKMLVT